MSAEVRILVDADACPVKEEIYRVAWRHEVPVTIVSNGGVRVPDHPLIERVVVSDKAWGQVPTLVKEAMVSAALKQAGEFVDSGAARGGFEDENAHLSRQPLKLDAKAWKELAKKVSDLHEYAVGLQKESEKRRNESDHHDEVDAGLVMMLFKAPPLDMPQEPAASDGKTAHKRSSRSRSRAKA